MKTLFFIALFSISASFAESATQSKLLTSDQLKTLEEQVDKELESSKLDDKKKLIANLLAGREFYQYRFYDKSKKYYESAIKIDVAENKTEAYINLMALAVVLKDKNSLQKAFDQATLYFQKNPAYKSEDVQYYLNSIENYLTGKNKNEVRGFFGQFSSEANLVELVKSKQYKEVLTKLNPEALGAEGSMNLETIIFDSVNVALNKKNVKSLYCTPQYKKYPKAYTYSILICGLLTDYLEKSKFDPARLKRAESYFNEMDKEKSYLLEVVKEIK